MDNDTIFLNVKRELLHLIRTFNWSKDYKVKKKKTHHPSVTELLLNRSCLLFETFWFYVT